MYGPSTAGIRIVVSSTDLVPDRRYLLSSSSWQDVLVLRSEMKIGGTRQ